MTNLPVKTGSSFHESNRRLVKDLGQMTEMYLKIEILHTSWNMKILKVVLDMVLKAQPLQ